MSEIIINRAPNKIDVNDFIRLTALHKDYSWLEYEPQALFELWCISEDEKQKTLIEFLIKNFSYINSKKLNDAGIQISNKIENDWLLEYTNTFLVATCGDSKPDGSQSIIQSLKNKFSRNWRENNFFNSIQIGANVIQNDSNIILIDDFIGTGDTILQKFKYLKSNLDKRGINRVSIRIVSLAAMDFSKEVLDKLNVEYFSVYWLKRGISELIEEVEERENATQSMSSLEEKLLKEYSGRKLPNFGYKRSEALFAMEAFNVPNNVFPIFWWPFLNSGVERKTLFKRI